MKFIILDEENRRTGGRGRGGRGARGTRGGRTAREDRTEGNAEQTEVQ